MCVSEAIRKLGVINGFLFRILGGRISSGSPCLLIFIFQYWLLGTFLGCWNFAGIWLVCYTWWQMDSTTWWVGGTRLVSFPQTAGYTQGVCCTCLVGCTLVEIGIWRVMAGTAWAAGLPDIHTAPLAGFLYNVKSWQEINFPIT